MAQCIETDVGEIWESALASGMEVEHFEAQTGKHINPDSNNSSFQLCTPITCNAIATVTRHLPEGHIAAAPLHALSRTSDFRIQRRL